ncbi:phosphonate ABC transporter, permease protein PhnE [Oharaeibacter diazotrophicus]|uniref:Phosphonate transport system permease protein n=1 Tax=Oharaeibacter diazotrophicus TaxID=1920512 RepID=A0A4R6RHH9_9HYPH|nr:phosphonate transport system permease protein [Oharaeibacter diazotrophicus]BBE74258.1 phosphate-import permease protein PhnE [Pleomorphomonas sp. SM30]GLS76052.1 phosphonate ABC transporter, permease protein PhnE [Oharaeibacter diazotrophicus]
MSLVPVLPDAQRVSLASGYAATVRARRIRLLVGLTAVVLLALVAGWAAEVRIGTFATNLWRFTSYLGRITPEFSWATPFQSLAAWYWNLPHWLSLLAETLLIAYLGTLMGAVVGFALSFLAAANLNPNPTSRFLVRRTMELLRTVPGVVFALLFVIAFGLGPMPGVFAVALHTAGALAKLYAEVVENVDMKPVEGVAAAGGSWLARVRFAVLPQVLPGFASYTLLRFEINVRESAVMGFVGAGGIGEDLVTSIRQFYYPDVSALLILIVATVMAIDFLTEKLRHHLIGLEGRAR